MYFSKPKHTRLKFYLEKLKDPNVLETFQALIGGRFAPLTIMSNEDTDIDSMITTFNTAVTETASEILGKHRQKKKPWVTAEILDQCDRRRELRKKRFEPEGSEKYKEVNNNIKRCMKKAKVCVYNLSYLRIVFSECVYVVFRYHRIPVSYTHLTLPTTVPV